MHEEKFLSSWLRKDVEGTEEKREKMKEEAKEEENKSGKREVERRGENGFQEKVCEFEFQ